MRFGITKPGGHYQEIRDLQRGLKNDIQKYNRDCKDNDDGSGGTFSAIARSIDEAANRSVPEPPINNPKSWSLDPPPVYDPRTDRMVPGSGGNGPFGAPPPPVWRYMLP